ncbi:MAG: aspartate aminotransferase family protein [Bacillota bacterium]|nr:aspartate aminotransferase family protein [Bacillota bacterium]
MKGKRPGMLRDIPGELSRKYYDLLLRNETGGTFWRAVMDDSAKVPVLESQDGIYVTDVDGNVYIETLGAFATSCLGYSPKQLIKVAMEQAERLMHVSDWPNIPRAELAQRLLEIAPGFLKHGQVQFELGGGPTVDLALELMHYASPPPRRDIITFFGGYHGRTVASVNLAANAYNREGFPGVNFNVIRVPYAYCYRCAFERTYPSCDMFCVTWIERLFESAEYGVYDPNTGTSLVAGLVVEPVQTHSGMIVPPAEFYQGLRRICDRYGLIFLSDAIPMSIGRSGKWFTCEHFGVTPDMITICKSISGGIWPLSALIARRDIAEAWANRPDKHMGTFHGNPVGCRAALEVIAEIERRNLLAHVTEVGNYFLDGLKALQAEHEVLADAAGLGLALGVEFVRDKRTKQPAPELAARVASEALRRGVILLRVGYFGNRITFMPPYIITKEEIDLILEVLDQSIKAAKELA